MSARIIQTIIALAALVWANRAPAQTESLPAPNSLHPDDLALGLEPLHWGMPAAEVRQALPDLMFSSDFYPSAEPSDAPMIARQPYRFSGCAFELTLRFFRDRLDGASLNSSQPVPACRWDVVHDLNAHFGTPAKSLAPPNGVEFEFVNAGLSSAVTSVGYFYADGPINIRFTPVGDISGRRAAQERYIKCQTITATVEVDFTSAGASAPEVIHDPDLGCEYPPVSVRLMESGAVELHIRVLADGSVSDATVVTADRHNRINDAAVRLAKTRLRFTPATQGGSPVESDVAMKLVFEVNHPIRGMP